MTCETCHELLLEAEPADLRGEGDTELAQHMRACPPCGARARQILEDLDALSDVLARQEPTVAVSGAVARAAVEARRRQKRRTLWRAAVPALAAAGLAGLLVAQRTTRELGVQSLPVERDTPARVPDVEAPVGRDYMVLGSDNSDIVIIWFF